MIKVLKVATESFTSNSEESLKIVKNAGRGLQKKAKSAAYNMANPLERTPKADSFQHVGAKKRVKKKEQPQKPMRIGDFYVVGNKKLAGPYLSDLEEVAQIIPQASFDHGINKNSVKSLESILDKLERRSALYEMYGFKGIIRDGVRATLYLPDADKNYTQVIKQMEKKGYNVSTIMLSADASGNTILENGLPKSMPDIDVRFGKKAVPSGYEDVQIRFEKKDNIYELLILHGPNYALAKEKEHKYVYEPMRKYDTCKITDDNGAKQIIKGLKKIFHGLTRELYADAKKRDTYGAIQAKRICFSKEDMKTADDLFKSLKNMYRGRYESLPPSKRKRPFKETEKFKALDEIEQRLRETMELYKPTEQ